MSYWIWDPHVPSGAENSVQFILTPSDAGPPSASKVFAAELLKDLSLEVGIQAVSQETFRSSYYTDYADSKDWRAVWPVVWRYRIKTDRRRIRLRVDERDIEAEAFAGKAIEDPDGPKRANCLVVADFGTEQAARSARTAVGVSPELEDIRRQHRAQPIQVNQLRIKPHYFQVQFDLGPFPREFFKAGAQYAKAVEAICRRRRATVHYDDRVA